MTSKRLRVTDESEIREDAEARRLLEQLDGGPPDSEVTSRLLVWLDRRVTDGAPE